MAYQFTKNDLYRQVVYETLDFLQREMTSPDGGFYSALDADSEGEEGKFYVWKKEELEKILGDRYKLFADYFSVNEFGEWEHGNYILLRRDDDSMLAKRFSMSVDELRKQIAADKKNLLAERNKRVRPGLDDKEITSWNALMIKGYCDAYNAFGEKKFLDAAIKSGNRNWTKYWREETQGYSHTYKNEKGSGSGFLEDYSFSAEAFIALYQCTFDEQWLERAKEITDYAIVHFYDQESKMFFFTPDDHDLIARKMEITDNVIPSSNSSMAKVLFYLSLYFDDRDYASKATQMLNNVKTDMKNYASGYSNWGILLLNLSSNFNEVVITGQDATQKRNELAQHFLPNVILAGATDDKSKLPLLENRFVNDKTLIYVCENKACKLPVENTDEAIKLLQ